MGFDDGCDDYAGKLTDRQKLIETIRQLLVERSDRRFHENLSHSRQNLAADAIFQSPQRGWRSQRLIGIRRFLGQGLQERAVAEGLALVEVFVAERYAKDVLGQHRSVVR